jgi:hypothetical protein
MLVIGTKAIEIEPTHQDEAFRLPLVEQELQAKSM